VAVHSRLKLDLPEELVGFAQWYKSLSNLRKSSYLLKSNSKWWPIEYLNSHWYYLTWNNKSEEYWVSSEDKVLSPTIFGLRTASAPYVMDLPQSTGQATPPPGPGVYPPLSRSTPIPILKHACMHWAFCKKSGCKWHA
jgi:hypothetical protein